MLSVKIKRRSEYITDHWFINPKCGHECKYTYNAPFRCTETTCNEKLPLVERLHADHNGQGNRVKYFVEGTP